MQLVQDYVTSNSGYFRQKGHMSYCSLRDGQERKGVLRKKYLCDVVVPPKDSPDAPMCMRKGVTSGCHNHNHHRRMAFGNMENKQTNMGSTRVPNRIGGFMTMPGGPLVVTAGFDP
ncbi:hypothetical protein CEXT_33281 [Caerostris extrusa]|uniref:Uncharacterized protein n=1 Tax=Caerostris extrusa TaxID=172846 RepID=A0AAV4T3P1_CAEEX|nr:hypothetical protein CEXT_33281 [Caerostris extrusa]